MQFIVNDSFLAKLFTHTNTITKYYLFHSSCIYICLYVRVCRYLCADACAHLTKVALVNVDIAVKPRIASTRTHRSTYAHTHKHTCKYIYAVQIIWAQPGDNSY